MRQMTLLVALVTAACGSWDSPAARVTISLPMKEKTTIRTPVRIAPGPWGRKPPCAVRLEKPDAGWSEPGSRPKSARETRMPGPAAAMPEPEPTNRPAPMTPPIAIIDRWRFLRPGLRPGSAGGASGRVVVISTSMAGVGTGAARKLVQYDLKKQ